MDRTVKNRPDDRRWCPEQGFAELGDAELRVPARAVEMIVTRVMNTGGGQGTPVRRVALLVRDDAGRRYALPGWAEHHATRPDRSVRRVADALGVPTRSPAR